MGNRYRPKPNPTNKLQALHYTIWLGQNILLGEVQNGSRKNRCGSDNIFILNTDLWKARAMGEKLRMGFVNIAKAYDSFDR